MILTQVHLDFSHFIFILESPFPSHLVHVLPTPTSLTSPLLPPTTMSSPRVAIVTGAGSGFGAGIARRFAKDGIAVVVADVVSACVFLEGWRRRRWEWEERSSRR